MQNDLFLEKPKYIIDTSSFILLRQTYPEDLFAPLHKQLLPIFTSGKIVMLDLVLEELKDKEKGLFDFIKSTIPKERQFSFVKYLQISQQLIHTYYDGKGKSHKLKADPHIISCAKSENIKIVSEEYNSDSTKIPFICSKEKVSCMIFLDFLREEKIKLT